MVVYSIENNLGVEEFKDVLIRSSLGERRPINDPSKLSKMLEMANLIVTARQKGTVIGVARSLSDFAFCTYLSDLAVDSAYQKKGIGRELIRRTKMESPDAKLILLAAPKAIPYYPKIGMTQYEYCYYLDQIEQLT